MKKWKKLTALLLAMVMTLGLAGTAFASEGGTYADVAGHWAEEEITRVVELGLIDGKTAAAFALDENMIRTDLVTALYRLAGKPAVTGAANPFTDVADGTSCKDAVLWAASKKIVNGKTETVFSPNGEVTRQEIAKILNGYAAVAKGKTSLTNRVATIGAIETALEKAFPGYSVRRGFTANIIIEHVNRRDGETIDDVKEALDRAVKNGVKNLLVQPTHLMNGYEYGDLRNLLEKKYADKFETIKIGAPLLTSDDDFARVAEANDTWYDRPLTFVSAAAVAK